MMPKYDEIMLPMLKKVSDGNEYTLRQLVPILAKEFMLGEEELKVMLPSGTQAMFTNRCSWAKTYLSKAGLLETVKRGVFKISERGLKVLKSNVDKIDTRFLSKYSDFQDFYQIAQTERNEEKPIQSSTPDETMFNAIELKKREMEDDILQRIAENSPQFFEKLVIKLLVKMGYGGSYDEASQVIGRSHDGGIDGVIKEDVLGLDAIYVQAKRYKGTVESKVIREFLGALEINSASKGVIITTSDFPKTAEQILDKASRRVVLINGRKLARLMIDYNVGVVTEETLEIKKIVDDFFEEEV